MRGSTDFKELEDYITRKGFTFYNEGEGDGFNFRQYYIQGSNLILKVCYDPDYEDLYEAYLYSRTDSDFKYNHDDITQMKSDVQAINILLDLTNLFIIKS